MPNQTKLYLNGIDGVTGEYLVPPLEVERMTTLIKGQPQDAMLVRWFKHIWRVISRPDLGLPLDIDPADVRQAGWGIVFHADEDEAVKSALAPLIEHRQRQINDDGKVKVCTVRPGESVPDWLARHRVGAGSVDPAKVPYYLLLIGDPARIPFTFGHLLDVEYAVGWLHFEQPAQYDAYVAALIDYETSRTVPNAKEAVFFAPRHLLDPATQLSADLLVNPLADGLAATEDQAAQMGVGERYGFQTRKHWGAAATKTALHAILSSGAGSLAPAFLLTASHGVGWPAGHTAQQSTQGALLCQDWPGLGHISPEHYFAAGDVSADSRLQGLISFHFACYSAGTPAHDRYFHQPGEAPPRLAEDPFIASLPQTLLAQGALACIGHVDRAWGYAIEPPAAGPQLIPFQNAIGRILLGQPVGCALQDFNGRYAALSAGLSGLLEDLADDPAAISDDALARHWTERNDAEGYLLLGDPAAHLRVDQLIMDN